MLSRPEGASGPQIAEAMGWAPHTVRGFLAGLAKKGMAVEVVERVRQVGPNKAGCEGQLHDLPPWQQATAITAPYLYGLLPDGASQRGGLVPLAITFSAGCSGVAATTFSGISKVRCRTEL